MNENLLVLYLAAIPLMGSPGPATLTVAATAAAFGSRPALPYLCGIILGTVGVLLLVATGVTGAILAVPALGSVIAIVAACYILYLAWRIATAPPLGQGMDAGKRPSLTAGFLLAIANPKAFAAIGAVFSGHQLIGGDVLTDSLVKILALAPLIVLINSAWLAFGSLIASALRDPRLSRMANICFAILLVISVGFALV
ncbi:MULTISPECIES: LysE family transporter [unclassified Minwuia]|jgi:threonine/homoserine/homoserine lactone efflux protein|uniref:LysE family translocator n=1 Tax=unclassified Minwuia TaxID=2618799 RepID=UPI002479E735|nr:MULTISPECIES: LysE family transporter [unclassified Minwuia]